MPFNSLFTQDVFLLFWKIEFQTEPINFSSFDKLHSMFSFRCFQRCLPDSLKVSQKSLLAQINLFCFFSPSQKEDLIVLFCVWWKMSGFERLYSFANQRVFGFSIRQLFLSSNKQCHCVSFVSALLGCWNEILPGISTKVLSNSILKAT